jgi:hypothetical protein
MPSGPGDGLIEHEPMLMDLGCGQILRAAPYPEANPRRELPFGPSRMGDAAVG